MTTQHSGRRQFRRRAVQLEVTVRFRLPRALQTKTHEGLTLVGRTRDLSEVGLAVVVSAGNIDRYLKQKQNSFDVMLRLPEGLLRLEATPVHFRRITSGGGVSYLIGSRLTNMNAEQRARLLSFLKSLPLLD